MSTLIQITPSSANFANTDLTFTGTRNHDTAGNALNVYVDIAYDKGYFDIGPFGSTFGFNRSFHSYGTNSIQGYANNSLIQTLTQTGVGIGTSTPAARLDVRAQGALSTDIAFRVRNSADTRNNFTVNGLGQTRVLSNSFSGNFFTISYVGDTSVERDAFIFTQAVQNAMGQAWTFDAGYNGSIEGFKLKNNLTGNNQGVFAIQANNYCFGTEISVSEGVIAERRVMRLVNGVAPTTSVTDGFKMYSADIVAGNAAPHFRTENGNIIKIYQETTAITAATFVANTSAIVDDSATYGGYTMGQVVAALKAQGLLA